MKRRQLLATGTSALAAVGLAGCLDGGRSSTSDRTHSTRTTTATTTETTRATGPGADVGADETTVAAVDSPDPDHAIWVENEADTAHRVTVTVAHHVDGGSDEVVYESTHELEPKGSKYVYNLNEANPDGVERFKVVGEADEQTAWRFVATSECYTDCGIVIRESGELVVERPIC